MVAETAKCSFGYKSWLILKVMKLRQSVSDMLLPLPWDA
jgi:hypothetical protein